MSDPITAAAFSAADLLTADYGPDVVAEVKNALHVHGTRGRPDQYVDPVSVGSLIVAIATLAWTIHTDLRKKKAQPSREVLVHQVRAELREYDSPGMDDASRITEIVVTGLIRIVRESS
jgi:hypothetical protein